MQPELRGRLEAAASESGRSLNAEITARLEASFRRSVDDDEVKDVIGSLGEKLQLLREDALNAKAAAVTAAGLVAELTQAAWTDDEIPAGIAKIRDAGLKVAQIYEAELAASDDYNAVGAMGILKRSRIRGTIYDASAKEPFVKAEGYTRSSKRKR